MCGEKCLDGITHGMIAGSPPRVRGKGPDDRAHPLVPGITPACAGKRKPHLHKKGCTWDHPRVCGEKAVAHIWWYSWIGSPPRMRGKDGVNDSAQAVTGITPACAGKSLEIARATQNLRDHPRVCGEKQSRQRCRMSRTGSPPRMRGKVAPMRPRIAPPGITPACAGKRDIPPQGSTAPGDHPRVCGEKPELPPAVQRHVGSPPRMRGKV